VFTNSLFVVRHVHKCHSIMRFSDVEDLRAHLISLDCDYGGYAESLWAGHMRTTEQLCNASLPTLRAAGVIIDVHAEDIKARAGEERRRPAAGFAAGTMPQARAECWDMACVHESRGLQAAAAGTACSMCARPSHSWRKPPRHTGPRLLVINEQGHWLCLCLLSLGL
jgi:hypothetical protein